MGTSYSATPTVRTNPVDTGWLDQEDRNFIPHKHLPKLDFPKFQGDNPKIWKKKCETYFEVFSVPAHLQTRYATLNFTDKAALWLETIEAKGRIELWIDLCNIVFDRWDKDQHSLTMHQILNIKQTRTVAEYIEKFDDLRHQLLLHDPSVSDVFFVTCFIEGLKDDISSVIALHRPVDMDIVSSLVMMREEENENGKKKNHTKHESSGRYSWKTNAADKTKDTPKLDTTYQKSEDKLGSLLAYRKSKGLCYKCGAKWSKNHVCPAQVPLHIMEEVLDMMQVSGAGYTVNDDDSDLDDATEFMSISDPSQPARPKAKKKPTIRLWGMIGKHQLLILVDSGSVGTFIGSEWVVKLKLKTASIHLSQYKAADGGLITCKE
jgi:hypothetical protein